MPNHKSAEKRLRQSEKRRVHNQSRKAAVRTAIKKVRRAIEEGNLDEARNLFRNAQRMIGKAVAKGLYHKQNGARKISRLARALNNAG
ncbi:MAG: 30S ribosomal protein S20 [Candidatus Dadabacteria bacterium]|nr:MAG: 30S ribosomal protein S20 [Candidatus Dadabacteria bacterium]